MIPNRRKKFFWYHILRNTPSRQNKQHKKNDTKSMKNRILVTLFCQKALFKSIFCLNCNEKSPLGQFTETGLSFMRS